jgi:hypothetical protein
MKILRQASSNSISLFHFLISHINFNCSMFFPQGNVVDVGWGKLEG